jgi:hypothetical protein
MFSRLAWPALIDPSKNPKRDMGPLKDLKHEVRIFSEAWHGMPLQKQTK